ncbi:carbohydrate ABC transporter permease [Georgenia muralis]|uniref:Carbohydrate ABC transporter membrane protein 2 (CUT1 family) n=1 Tax=Georgenia muralis TaxID=154117 RepID=A0A3N4ZMW5_9MICO|nr:carbohydrate ABC transporter permease [Georgenia muralis]RPF27032.1 carbohydrate ABC transporter membrane protein 2 (CUT1 family) [Georgenia muralis]
MTTTAAEQIVRAPREVIRSSRRRAKTRAEVWRWIAIVVVSLVFLFPLMWMLISAFKTSLDITDPGAMFTFEPTLRNFENVLGRENFLPFIWNSLVVGVVSTGIALVVGVPAAYAMTRFHMNRSSGMLLVARIIPGVSLLVPWYFVFSRMGLVGGYTPLVISHMFVTLPLIAWIMLSFFEGIPAELEEAGRVDGLTNIGVFARIALPLAVPGIATASILAFIFSWNNFLFALVLSGEATRTLPVAIFNFIAYSSIDWGGLMAASVIITLPVMIMALFTQKYIVSGLTAGATKG